MQVEANLKSHVILNCNHVGVPKPNITWTTPQNQQISINHLNYNRFKYELINETSLRINSLETKDAGSYRCSALNQYSNSYLRKKQGAVILTVLNQQNDFKIIPTTTASIKLEKITIPISTAILTNQSNVFTTTKKYLGNLNI